ncbi:MAG TPA: hypothetical protein VMS77_05475 [Conexivisphaerales archaeon]|nr:hypothetical protein [Conexivisphaerales archaeon]
MASQKVDIGDIFEEVSTYAVTLDLATFVGSRVSEGSAVLFRWDDRSDDWKAFVDVARNAGAPCLVIETAYGTGSHSQELGFIELSWAKDGAVYSFVKTADWWSRKESKDAWMAKSDDEVANDMLKFAANTYGRDKVPPLDELAYEFWRSLGVTGTFSENPELKMRMMRISKKVEERRVKADEELVPKLVDDVIEWCRLHQLRRITQATLDSYLADKRLSLSKAGRDDLRNQVNFRLSA